MKRFWITGRSQLGVRSGIGSVFAGVVMVMIGGCSERSATPPAISLVEGFGAAEVSESPSIQLDFPRLEWRFDGVSPIAPKDDPDATVGWSAFNDIDRLRVRDGELQGRAGDLPILTVAVPENAFPRDRL